MCSQFFAAKALFPNAAPGRNQIKPRITRISRLPANQLGGDYLSPMK